MRYVIYGAGAVGGVIGARLHLAGTPVTLIARGAHLAAIRDRGLTLDAADGRHAIRTPATDTAAEVEWTDDTVVLLCVKSQQTAAALADLRAHAPASTPVVAVQNGVANEAQILRHFANTYAVCVILPGVHLEPGVVAERATGVPALLDVGRFPSGVDATAEAIAADLVAAGMLSEPRAEIMAWKYRKLMNNLGNGADAACVPGEAADELVRRCQAEGEAAVAAAGIPMVTAAQDRERRANHLTPFRDDVDPHGSTWQSVSRGTGDVEIDYLAGEIVLLGRLHGVATPANELMVRVVHDLVSSKAPAASVDAAELLRTLDAIGRSLN